jgi:hypothetical protein
MNVSRKCVRPPHAGKERDTGITYNNIDLVGAPRSDRAGLHERFSGLPELSLFFSTNILQIPDVSLHTGTTSGINTWNCIRDISEIFSSMTLRSE